MSIFKKVFSGSREKQTDEAGEMSPTVAEKVIQEYGAILESQAPSPGCVADAKKLPYRKQKIKEALIIGLRSTTDPQLREFLKVGYIQLADWQEGVGETDVGIDLSEGDLANDPMKLAEKISTQGAGLDKWIEIVKAEQKELESELRQMGLW